jgi:threonine dehydrogenase-like Zn-dependent dehydrogenase
MNLLAAEHQKCRSICIKQVGHICKIKKIRRKIADGKLDTEPLITHTYPLSQIDEAYELFENKSDGVIKVAVEC